MGVSDRLALGRVLRPTALTCVIGHTYPSQRDERNGDIPKRINLVGIPPDGKSVAGQSVNELLTWRSCDILFMTYFVDANPQLGSRIHLAGGERRETQSWEADYLWLLAGVCPFW